VPDPDGLADRWKWSGGVGGVCTSVLKRGEAEEIRGVGSWVRLTTNGCYSLAPPTTVCAAFRRTRIVSLRPCPCFLCWLAESFVPMFFLSCKSIIFPTYICEGGRSDAGGSFRAPPDPPSSAPPPAPTRSRGRRPRSSPQRRLSTRRLCSTARSTFELMNDLSAVRLVWFGLVFNQMPPAVRIDPHKKHMLHIK
jgi:hypothetical protein